MRLYVQGPPQVMRRAERIVVNLVRDAERVIKRYRKPFLLDNGACQGRTVGAETLIEAVERLRPELVVAPDKIRDSRETLRMHREFAELASNKILERSIAVFRPKLYEVEYFRREIERMGFTKIGIPSGEEVVWYINWRRLKEEGFYLHVLGMRDGTYELLFKFPFDSIDIVCTNVGSYERIRMRLEVLNSLLWGEKP